jgi:hypothetical protein
MMVALNQRRSESAEPLYCDEADSKREAAAAPEVGVRVRGMADQTNIGVAKQENPVPASPKSMVKIFDLRHSSKASHASLNKNPTIHILQKHDKVNPDPNPNQIPQYHNIQYS